MSSRLSAFFIWAAVAVSVAFWGLRWLAKPMAIPVNAVPVSMESGATGDFRKLLAGPPVAEESVIDPGAQSALAGRIRLQGAFASGNASGEGGVALLALDGQPARAYRTGQLIDGDMVLQSVDVGGVRIGPRGEAPVLTLPLPTLPAPTTGSLPAPTGVTPVGTTPTSGRY